MVGGMTGGRTARPALRRRWKPLRRAPRSVQSLPFGSILRGTNSKEVYYHPSSKTMQQLGTVGRRAERCAVVGRERRRYQRVKPTASDRAQVETICSPNQNPQLGPHISTTLPNSASCSPLPPTSRPPPDATVGVLGSAVLASETETESPRPCPSSGVRARSSSLASEAVLKLCSNERELPLRSPTEPGTAAHDGWYVASAELVRSGLRTRELPKLTSGSTSVASLRGPTRESIAVDMARGNPNPAPSIVLSSAPELGVLVEGGSETSRPDMSPRSRSRWTADSRGRGGSSSAGTGLRQDLREACELEDVVEDECRRDSNSGRGSRSTVDTADMAAGTKGSRGECEVDDGAGIPRMGMLNETSVGETGTSGSRIGTGGGKVVSTGRVDGSSKNVGGRERRPSANAVDTREAGREGGSSGEVISFACPSPGAAPIRWPRMSSKLASRFASWSGEGPLIEPFSSNDSFSSGEGEGCVARA